MKTRVEDAFHDVVDLSPEDRVRYFAEHGVGADTRREIEALAEFDSDPNTSLVRDIGRVADRVATHMEPKDLRCGPYQLINVLGRGGMGAVYFALRVDGEVKQRVAVKLLRQGADTPQFRKRFLVERHAKAMQAGDQVVINQSLMMRGAIYRSTGDLSRAGAMLAEVEPRLRRSLPAGHPALRRSRPTRRCWRKSAGTSSADPHSR